MMLKRNRLSAVAGRPLLTLALLMSLSTSLAAPVGSAFTYQGQLKGGGGPASGTFGMQFRLFDDVAAGAQVGATIDKVVAVTNGLFTVELDFGSFAFTVDARWLEIRVDGVTLSPRQPLTGVPYAARALSAPNGHSLDGANGGPVDALIVDHDGQVGIGNTDPTQKLHVIDTLDAGLTFPVKIANNGATNGTAVGVFFQVGTASDRGKGAIVYERTNNFNRGDFHILQNSTADGATPGLTNSVLTIKNDGNVGIGTTSPKQRLHVAGDYYGRGHLFLHAFEGDGDSGTAYVQARDDSATSSINLQFRTKAGANLVDAMRLTSAGNVGIGTNTPGKRLHVGSTAVPNSEGMIRLQSLSGLGGASRTWDIGVPETDNDATGAGYSFVIDDPARGSDPEVIVRWDSGNVGIGTSTPAAALHVNSPGNVSAIVESPSTIGTWFSLRNSTVGGQYWQFISTGSGNGEGAGKLLIGPGTSPGFLSLSAMTITPAGNVGIGTTSPTSKLRVEHVGATGTAVYGKATATAPNGNPYGVLGVATGGSGGYGVFAEGNLGATGTKPFRIDHPDDPTNKYLLHYATEAPEPINFYRGIVVLDGVGEAVVELPHYFAKINKTPSYQLTAVGAPMPMLHVAEEIDEFALSAGATAGPGVAAPISSFRIAGGAPRGKVSWRVEAVRNDLWVRNSAVPTEALRNGQSFQTSAMPVEVDKQGPEKGTYQHPEFYNQPPEMGMNYDAERRAIAARPAASDAFVGGESRPYAAMLSAAKHLSTQEDSSLRSE